LAGIHLDRVEAMVLLKELVFLNLAEPSLVSIEQREPKHYQIQIKNNFNSQKLQEYIQKNDLVIEEDKEKRYLVISRP